MHSQKPNEAILKLILYHYYRVCVIPIPDTSLCTQEQETRIVQNLFMPGILIIKSVTVSVLCSCVAATLVCVCVVPHTRLQPQGCNLMAGNPT